MGTYVYQLVHCRYEGKPRNKIATLWTILGLGWNLSRHSGPESMVATTYSWLLSSLMRVWRCHTSPVYAMLVSPDSTRIATPPSTSGLSRLASAPTGFFGTRVLLGSGRVLTRQTPHRHYNAPPLLLFLRDHIQILLCHPKRHRNRPCQLCRVPLDNSNSIGAGAGFVGVSDLRDCRAYCIVKDCLPAAGRVSAA